MTRDDHEADCALRSAVRGEVAGATPRGDAWLRLQRRIAAEAAPQPVVVGFDRPVIMSPWSPRSPWTLGIVSRFSQVGAALLALTLLFSQPSRLETWLGAARPAIDAPASEVRPAVAGGAARDQLLLQHEARLRASIAQSAMPAETTPDPLPPAIQGLGMVTAGNADLVAAGGPVSARIRQQFDPDRLSPLLLHLDPQ